MGGGGWEQNKKGKKHKVKTKLKGGIKIFNNEKGMKNK
jgi:hypothetical protein